MSSEQLQIFCAKIIKDTEPTHGKVSKIYFEEDILFEGIEQGFEATRYHSLIVDNESLTDCIVPLAYTEAKSKKQKVKGDKILVEARALEECHCEERGTSDEAIQSFYFLPFASCLIMALKHREYPTYGVQFHPEAILTQYGKIFLNNFISI